MSANKSSTPPPPSYVIPTLYDETFRSRSHIAPTIMSMGNRPNLIGYLDHHAPTTDGSFSMVIIPGDGAFISQALYESIPADHRPVLDKTDAGQAIGTLFGPGDLKCIGSIFFPLILTNKETGQRFRIVLRTLVMPNLLMSMYIGNGGHTDGILRYEAWEPGSGPTFGFDFRGDRKNLVYVQGR
ncbi:hypothetical protein CPC08DRAFT_723452 [Agrocybe pediades]|nr:hypothetical protein CPC08DRAFT_723452 [Agrocybe pediades]